MEIGVQKFRAGTSLENFAIRFAVANMTEEEQTLLKDYGLASFVLAQVGGMTFTFSVLASTGLYYEESNIDLVLDFEKQVRAGLVAMEEAARQRADFFKAKRDTISVTFGIPPQDQSKVQ